MGPITQLLRARAAGDHQAASALFESVYQQLHQLAASALRHERAGHTLSPTALVHEVYLKLAQEQDFSAKDRAEFLKLASYRMRQVLVDIARAKGAEKRGGTLWLRATLDAERIDAERVWSAPEVDTLALEQALLALENIDARKVRVVELRYFAGLEMQDIADTLAISRATAQRDWEAARAFLYLNLSSS